MSVYFNNDTDVLNGTLTTLTVGTGSISFGFWLNIVTDTGGQGDLIHLGTSPHLGAWVFANGNDVGGYANSHDTNTIYALSTGTWVWVAVTFTGGTTLRTRVFSDHPSSTTPLSDQSRSDFSLDLTTLSALKVGNAGAAGASPALIQNVKIQTGVLWSDAECRTEALYYGIQKSGGTDRLCWRLKDVDADTDGLYEIGGSGPNLTNSGAIADAGAPTNLSEFAAGTTLYFLDSAASGSNFGQLQVGGSAPSTATTATGWTVDTVGATNYALMAYASERASTVFSGTAQPAGNPDNTLGDCFRSTNTMTGDFATGVWTITVPVIAVTAASGQDGRVRVRLWKSSNADGSSATEITSGAVTGTTVTDLTTGAEQTSVATTSSITGFSLANEYLFLQVAWEITGAAT